MRYWTYLEIKTKIQADLDLEDETFVQPTELLAYANEAIDEAEAEIHSSYEDYFLSRTTVTLVNGTEGYALPSTIYANKIRGVIYKNGTQWHMVQRIRDWRKFEEYTSQLVNPDSGSVIYRYIIDNSTAGTPKMVFSPTPVEAGSYITVWHYRNANRLTLDADICDIPEFVNFVIQYMKVRCYEKELHPNLQMAVAALEQQRQLMKATLANMVPDVDNEIEMDRSHYEEHN